MFKDKNFINFIIIQNGGGFNVDSYLASSGGSSENSSVSNEQNNNFSELTERLDSMSPEEIMNWYLDNPNENYASFIDTLINDKIAQRNREYENEFNIRMRDEANEYNSPEKVMERLGKAGINPVLAFKSISGGNGATLSSSGASNVRSSLFDSINANRNYELSKYNSGQSNTRSNISSALGILGALLGLVGMLI